ncbi:MAG: hypothetical protein QM831_12535 [Kofleriaceae bacterium]
MADPTYKGAQPSGVSRFFGSFMNPTPNYIGAGQPAQRSSLFGGSSPAYLPAPEKTVAKDADDSGDSDDDANAACAPPGFLIVVPRTDGTQDSAQSDNND